MPGTDTPLPANLTDAAHAVLTTPSAADKVALTRRFVGAWASGEISQVGRTPPPDRPARPAKPDLRAPKDVPRRRLGSDQGRAAFVHAIAHIELNAIDLAWDITARFVAEDLPRAFYDDWCAVALDEAEHFDLLCHRLSDFGAAYGDMPAHDGLWQAAADTADDLLPRLAVVPMVLEARGLDTTPAAVERLKSAGDPQTASILEKIGLEEIPHVAAGVRWFDFICGKRGLDPAKTFQTTVKARFQGVVKPPFNAEARAAARFPEAYYAPLAA